MSANAQAPPELAAPHEGQWLRAGALHGLLDYVAEARATDRGALLRELSGLELPSLAEDVISHCTYLETLARLDCLSDGAPVMLQAGLAQDLGALGLFGKAMVHAETLWSAIQILRHGIAAYQPGAGFDVRLRFGRCRLRYRHPFGEGAAQALDVQYTIGLLCNLLSESARVATARLSVRYPGARTEHRVMLGTPDDLTDVDSGMVEFDDHLLRAPLRRSAPNVSDVIVAALDVQAAAPEAPQYAVLVRALQAASVEQQHRPLSQAEMCWYLDVPVRTLQHHLNIEGTRFERLRDQGRHSVARRELSKGTEIEDVALKIGFRHRQSFSEAFSKWEGCSPSVYRSRAH